MKKRTLGVAILLLSLSHGAASALEEAGERALDPEEATPQNPIAPAPAELERFELPRAVSARAGDPGHRPGSPLFQISGLGMFAASAADVATTEWGLARGLQEANPVAAGRGLRLVHHVAGPAAVWWTTEHLKRHGRTKLALGIRVALMAAYSYAAVHNARQVGALPPSR